MICTKKAKILTIFLGFILISLACNLPGQAATAASTATLPPLSPPAASATQTGLPAAINTPVSSPTPVPTITGVSVKNTTTPTEPTLTPIALTTAVPPTLAPPTLAPPTPAPTRTPTPNACGFGPVQRVKVGQDGFVCTKKDPVVLRLEPNRGSDKIALLVPGTTFKLTGGPVCDGDWAYWKVRTTSNQVGWVAEGGDEVDPYFICP